MICTYAPHGRSNRIPVVDQEVTRKVPAFDQEATRKVSVFDQEVTPKVPVFDQEVTRKVYDTPSDDLPSWLSRQRGERTDYD